MKQADTTSAGMLHRLDRWMYRGGRPNRLARVLNRIGAVQYAHRIAAPRPEAGGVTDLVGSRGRMHLSCPDVVDQHG